MAASPLADVNWNDLTGADSNTVIHVLQSAFNERLVVAMTNTGLSVNQRNAIDNFFPFPDDNPSNTPDWGPIGTPSLWRWTNRSLNTDQIMDRVCQAYADMTFINANINTVITDIEFNNGSQGGTIKETDLCLTPTKVFNYIGITEWPRVFNPNKTELKQWYDILKLLTHVYMAAAGSTGSIKAISGSLVKSEWSGIFEGTSEPFDKEYFDGGSPSLIQLASDWAQLYSGPRSREQLSTSAAPLNDTNVGAEKVGSKYSVIAVRLYTVINNQDLTDTGYTRVPLETQCFGQWDLINNAGSETDAYFTSNGLTDLKLIEFPASSARSASEVEVQADDAAFSLPSFSDGVEFSAKKKMRFFDNWNDPTGATGFQFYTP